MKKLIFAVFAMAMSFNTYAQISLGARVGINLANQTSEAEGISISPKSITGLSFAIPIEIGVSDKFSVQPELMYIQKGSKFEGEGDNSIEGVVSNLDIPILAKYKFVDSESVGAYLAAGPVLGFALSGKSKVVEDGKETSTTIDFEEADYKRFEFGLSIGAGVGIPAGPGSIVLDLRYVLGMTDLNESTDFEVTTKNNGFGISLGYMFPLGGGE